MNIKNYFILEEFPFVTDFDIRKKNEDPKKDDEERKKEDEEDEKEEENEEKKEEEDEEEEKEKEEEDNKSPKAIELENIIAGLWGHGGFGGAKIRLLHVNIKIAGKCFGAGPEKKKLYEKKVIFR